MFKKIFNNYNDNLILSFTVKLVELMPGSVTFSILLMVLISFTEALGLLLLIPILEIVGISTGQGTLGQIEIYITAFFNNFGLNINLYTVLIFYVIIISFGALLRQVQTIKTSKIEYEFGSYFRKSLYNAVTNSRWLYFSKIKSSDFAHALTNEIERISFGTDQFLTLIANIMILIVYLIFALKIAGIIVAIIFLVGIILLIFLRKQVNKSRESGEEITKGNRDIYSFIMQHLAGMKTIKSFEMENYNIKLFSQQSDKVTNNYLRTIKSYADVKLLFDVGTVVILAIMVIILIQIIKLPTASLLLLIYLFVRMIPQFSMIQHSYQYFINMLPAYENVLTMEQNCNSNFEKEDLECKKIEIKRSFKLKNISFSYLKESKYSIKNLNLILVAGKTTALVGPSGAGKSTIADIIMGLIKPCGGDIIVDDIPLNSHSYCKDKIGYVAQETFLFNESIKYNLQLAQPEACENDIINALKSASAYEFVMKLPEGLNTFIGDRGVKLSGGERQRLALARALLKKPSLLILDEATSNLDSENEGKILETIENLHGNITILIIAHRISTIKSADLIYLIDDGEILESGTWNYLISKDGYFKKILDVQNIIK